MSYAPPLTYALDLDQDSEDFSQDDADKATIIPDEGTWRTILTQLNYNRIQLKRRSGVHYCVIHTPSGSDHTYRSVYRLDWMVR